MNRSLLLCVASVQMIAPLAANASVNCNPSTRAQIQHLISVRAIKYLPTAMGGNIESRLDDMETAARNMDDAVDKNDPVLLQESMRQYFMTYRNMYESFDRRFANFFSVPSDLMRRVKWHEFRVICHFVSGNDTFFGCSNAYDQKIIDLLYKPAHEIRSMSACDVFFSVVSPD